jgi:17beta-estradiol 17-dehydrogenase / very-long-chain 3-oxoacyl-CoA reductase
MVVFYIGVFFLLRWFWRIARAVKDLSWGTKVTTDRYGPKGTVWALVTGATDGIGKAIVFELAARGFNVVLVSRSIDKLSATAKEIKEKNPGVQTRTLVMDFTEDTSMSAYQSLAKRVNDIDIGVLVNNVGVAVPFENTPQSTYKEIACNCYPIVLLTQQLIVKMEERFKNQK